MEKIAERKLAISAAGKSWNELTVEIYYDLGGMNYFSGKQERRGYYFSLTPETVSHGMRTYESYTGMKVLFQQVKRRTKKQDALAVEKFGELWDKYVPLYCEKYGIRIVC